MSVLKLPGLRSSVAFDSIVWVEGHGNYSWVYFTHQPRYLWATTLKRVEAQLPGFIRVHKSALINPSYVDKITMTGPRSLCIRMSDGAKLLVARRRLGACVISFASGMSRLDTNENLVNGSDEHAYPAPLRLVAHPKQEGAFTTAV